MEKKENGGGKREQLRSPACDIYEADGSYSVLMDLPGVSQESLEVSCENGKVRIVGRTAAKSKEGYTNRYGESCGCVYQREFSLTEYIDEEHISAQLKDGVLLLSLPKAEALKPRRIEITAS